MAVLEKNLQEAVEALENIKNKQRPINSKLVNLPFMQQELLSVFHQTLTEFKVTGEISYQSLKYFKFWISYFDLEVDDFREIVFTKSL